MGISNLDLSGFVRARAKVARLANADFRPLMKRWETVMEEDNARGLLAGLDCNDRKMPATKREKSVGKSRRQGGGPPLVPMGSQSRAIRNAKTGSWGEPGGLEFGAWLGWVDFEAASNGKFILGMHAHATNAPYPRRDVISKPRPTAIRLARADLRAFVKELLSR